MSQAGQVEAEMAISCWALCGMPGLFKSDKVTAVAFVDSATLRATQCRVFHGLLHGSWHGLTWPSQENTQVV